MTMGTTLCFHAFLPMYRGSGILLLNEGALNDIAHRYRFIVCNGTNEPR